MGRQNPVSEAIRIPQTVGTACIELGRHWVDREKSGDLAELQKKGGNSCIAVSSFYIRLSTCRCFSLMYRISQIAGNLSLGVLERMGNVLERVTIPAHPIIERIKNRMKELGAAGSMMSGSGPTVFGIFTEKERAEQAFIQLEREQLAKQIFLTEFC